MAHRLGASLRGIQPDILGELAVLDSLRDSEEASTQLASAGLRLAWRFDQLQYAAFTERAARDHPWHPNVADLLSVDPAGDSERNNWFALATRVVPYLGSSANPSLKRIARLLQVQAAPADEPSERALKVMLFQTGNLLLADDRVSDAIKMYTAVIDDADPAWETHASSLTNRGVAYLRLDRTDDAKADFAAVIDAPLASDEAKACCLNNRADLRFEDGDLAGSIADRTAVLLLADTTYTRRYIARARRARAFWEVGNATAALGDLQAVLDEPDIVIEQKLSARLLRAEWRAELGQVGPAIDDLRLVVEGRRNFEGVRERAASLLEQLPAS